MEKEKKEMLDEMLKENLESSTIEMRRAGSSIPINCFFEPDTIGTDRCFAYESKNGLRIFQIALLSDNKNVSTVALSSIDFQDPYLLKDLLCVGAQIISEEPSEVRSLKDLSSEIEIEGYTFMMTHQSPSVKITGTTLFENYAKRVIKRNSL